MISTNVAQLIDTNVLVYLCYRLLRTELVRCAPVGICRALPLLDDLFRRFRTCQVLRFSESDQSFYLRRIQNRRPVFFPTRVHGTPSLLYARRYAKCLRDWHGADCTVERMASAVRGRGPRSAVRAMANEAETLARFKGDDLLRLFCSAPTRQSVLM